MDGIPSVTVSVTLLRASLMKNALASVDGRRNPPQEDGKDIHSGVLCLPGISSERLHGGTVSENEVANAFAAASRAQSMVSAGLVTLERMATIAGKLLPNGFFSRLVTGTEDGTVCYSEWFCVASLIHMPELADLCELAASPHNLLDHIGFFDVIPCVRRALATQAHTKTLPKDAIVYVPVEELMVIDAALTALCSGSDLKGIEPGAGLIASTCRPHPTANSKLN